MRLLLLLLALAAGVHAQTSTGQITGTVQDSSGAMVPNATVRLIGAETGDLVRTLTTDDTGAFAAPLLRPGTYTVEAEHTGFKKLVRPDVPLRVDDVLTLRLTLQPGAANESVTVTAEAPLIEEKSHNLGQVVTERQIQQLPLNGRNYLQLGNLTAGAVPNDRSRDRSFSAYGNRGLQNSFLLDGARNQSYMRGLDNRQRDAMRPSLEAIAEFKVQTSNFSAEYGASAGAVVNVVTKGGTNEVHGSAFEFLRNSAFDARNYFQPKGTKQPLYIQHQYGGALGGPLVKNRAWWFGAFQRTHITEETTLTSTVPTVAQKRGEFGTTRIFDPLTTRPDPARPGQFLRDPFPGNIIPADRIDPVARRLVALFPDPQISAAARNYVLAPLESTRINNATFRGDVRLTDQDSLFGRYSFNTGSFLKLPALPLPAQTGVLRDTPSYSVGVGYTRVLSPTVVNELRFAWNRVGFAQDGTLPRDEIVRGSLAETVETGIPMFNVTGFAGLGAEPPNFGNNPSEKSSGVWNVSNNMTVVRSRHTLKFGVDYQNIRVSTISTLTGRGSFAFNGVFTQDPGARPTTGAPLADFLLGLPTSISTGTGSTARERAQNWYWYAQDDWTITPTLTVNLGLRYELTRPYNEADNRMANFILDPGDALYGQLILAGDDRRPRTLFNTDWNNVAPRIGLAWRTPAKGLVLRGGYGMFYGQDEAFGVSQRVTNNPPFFGFGGVNQISDQLLPSSTIALSGALPARPAPVQPQDFRLDPRATFQLRSWEQTYVMPVVHQWSVSVQQALPWSTVLEVNYVGNRGRSLWAAYEGNQPLPGAGAVNDRRPLAQFTRASVLRMEPWAESSYEGVSARLERRFSRGLSLLAAYTFGRSLDTSSNVDLCDGCPGSSGANAVQDTRNRQLNYGPSDHNVPQRFVLSGVYELPFGPGRAALNQGMLARLVGGWDISGIVTFSDGLPFTPTLSFDRANTGTTPRPDRLRDGRLDNGTVERWFDVNAFAFPAVNQFGNSGRNVLTGPGLANFDVMLQRNFRLPFRDGAAAQFRAEAFNAVNHPQFSVPNAVIGTDNAGTIGGTSQTNRQLQLSLKVTF